MTLRGCRTGGYPVLLAFLLSGAPAAANTFTVDSTADVVDALPGNAKCRTAAGECTLRAAVQEVNALAGDDVIVLPAGTYTLSIAPSDGTDATGDLELAENVTIRGAGAAVTIIDGGALDRIFEVYPPTATVVIEGVTIQNGNVASGGGGGVLNYGTLTLRRCVVQDNVSGDSGGGGIKNATGANLTVEDGAILGNDEDDSGGGIANLGTGMVTIRNSLVEGNTANFTGGGIVNDGTMTIEGTTIRTNTANTPGTFTFYGGGGIANDGTLTMRDSTISGNTASATGGGGLQNLGTFAYLTNVTISGNTAATDGGGIWNNFAGGNVILYNCTVAGNTAATGGGIYTGFAGSGPYTLASESILAGNTGGNCAGAGSTTSWDLHHNIDSGTSCGFADPTDLSSTDPMLGPLVDNGGLVETREPMAGSPAIDGGDPSFCYDPFGAPLTADARGASRPLDGDSNGSAICDIGAVEHFDGTDLIFEDGFDGGS